jgi:hypothetical protein
MSSNLEFQISSEIKYLINRRDDLEKNFMTKTFTYDEIIKRIEYWNQEIILLKNEKKPMQKKIDSWLFN